ncbi:MAG: hypothetical protein IJ654_05110 [Bacteroidales bacterium]|nr:hypothetical protein [Bacteroidales bacterium]
MKRQHYFLTYFLLLILQILICNYLHVSPYLMLSILPVMILMLPIRFGTVFAMILAFVSGLAVDFLAEGVIGLNALALVPVALARKGIIYLIFGSEFFARKEDISIRKHGVTKMSVALVMAQTLFLLIYIWADGAATRPFLFNTIRFAVSLAAGLLLSLLLSHTLATNDHDL